MTSKTVVGAAAVLGLSLTCLASPAEAHDWSIGIGIGFPGLVAVPYEPAYVPPPPVYYVPAPPRYYPPPPPPSCDPYYCWRAERGHHWHHDDDDDDDD